MPYGYDPLDPYGLKKQQQVPMQGMQPPGGAPQPGMGIMPQGAPPQAGSSAAEQAQIGALLETYGDQQELGALEKQMAQAEALRMETPEMRGNGRVMTAANPLEHLGKGIGDYKLMKKRQANDAEQGGLRKKIGESVKTYGGILTKDM